MLTSKFNRILYIILFTPLMSYWFLTLILTLIIVRFLSLFIFPSIKFTSTFAWGVLCECPSFIFHLDHIKSFQAHVFHFNTWSLTSSKPISISLTMRDWLFMDTHFIDNDTPKPNSTSIKTKNCLMSPGIYTTLYIFIKFF